MDRAKGRYRTAFTLVELLVVVSIIALLISILLPSLKKAREQTKTVVCLANLKGMSSGTLTYAAEYGGILPGPLHPAVFRLQTVKDYLEWGFSQSRIPYARGRQLTWKLHETMGQKGDGHDGKNVADDLSTCPTTMAYAPDSHFRQFIEANPNRKGLFPFHYTLNHWGKDTATSDSTSSSGFTGNIRCTNPQYYFGLSSADDASKNSSPTSMGRIKRTSDEWMLADAWYRAAPPSGFQDFQQEGPYQSQWSGEAIPYFAPHFKRGVKTMTTNPTDRKKLAEQVQKTKSDGKTNATYFDGHGATVGSQSLSGNNIPILYGFRGTVNPYFHDKNMSKIIWDAGVWK